MVLGAWWHDRLSIGQGLRSHWLQRQKQGEAFRDPRGCGVCVPHLGAIGATWVLCRWFWDPAPKKKKNEAGTGLAPRCKGCKTIAYKGDVLT